MSLHLFLRLNLILLFYNIFFATHEVPCCLCAPRSLRQNQHQYPSSYSAAKDLKALLDSVQSHTTDEELNRVVDALKGKSLHQLIAEGTKRVGSSAPAPAASGKAKEEKK